MEKTEIIPIKVEEINGVLVTTSNRVVEELEVRHDHLMEKIEDYLKKFSSPELSGQFYLLSNYKTSNGRTVKNYLITEKGVAQLVGGYSSAVPKAFELNVAYINEFERMRNVIKNQKLVPQSFAQALKLAYEQQLEIERLEIENKEKQNKIEVQEQVIADYEPKVSYYDTILQSQDVMTVTQIGSDYGISAKELNKILCEKRIQRKVNGSYILYKEHMNKGYTKSKTFNIETRKGTITKVDLRCTQKGRLFIHKILLDLGIYAEMDKENDYIERNLF